MINTALEKLVDHVGLTDTEAHGVMLEIMQGAASDAQIAAYLTALRMKGETVEEITGSVRAMNEMAVRIYVGDPQVVDTCGTGGDRANTFNISTAAAFVIAGGGITVAKHGNRSVSSRSGSADVLAAMDVNISLPPERVEACINEIGIGFLFAPLYHGAMKRCAAPRAAIGIRTLMNLLGPLSNPAGANIHILGVADRALTDKLAQVLMRLGTQHCFVLHGKDGLDEITLTDVTYVSESRAGRVSSYHLAPEDFNLTRVRPEELRGGTPQDNAAIILDVLTGHRNARRNVVLMNAAPAFVACGKAKSLQEGYAQAANALDSGAAYETYKTLVAFSNRIAA